MDTTQSNHRHSLLLGAVCFLILFGRFSYSASGQTYVFSNAQVQFISEAPLEVIKASNKEVIGALDLSEKSFVVQIKNTGFRGFNSPLQQEHFYENYLEVHKFPRSSFKGKLIDSFDPTQTGVQEIRIKGVLDIHGVQQERIVKVALQIGQQSISFNANFTVQLEDHQISIPRIVYQKIAEEIKVQAMGQLKVKQP